LTKAEAIKAKCQECETGPKGVTLCHLIDCPLWEFRFGNSMSSKYFWERMKKAQKTYEKDFRNMIKVLKDYIRTPDFSLKRGSYDPICKKLDKEMGLGLGREK